MAEVQLYIYDLSAGLAQIVSTFTLGKKIDGIWHTSVVVFGKEYSFGIEGVSTSVPGSPQKVINLGSTCETESSLLEYVRDLGKNGFANRLSAFSHNLSNGKEGIPVRVPCQNISHSCSEKYCLISHNCNTFSNELCKFLIGKTIPEHIRSLPDDVIDCIAINSVAAGMIASVIHTLINRNRKYLSDDCKNNEK